MIGLGEQLRAGRHREGVVVQERPGCLEFSEIRRGCLPGDMRCGLAGHLSSERAREQLPAEADAEQRLALLDPAVHERDLGRDRGCGLRGVVGCVHRSGECPLRAEHDDEVGVVGRILSKDVIADETAYSESVVGKPRLQMAELGADGGIGDDDSDAVTHDVDNPTICDATAGRSGPSMSGDV